jgi:hypothetical protein
VIHKENYRKIHLAPISENMIQRRAKDYVANILYDLCEGNSSHLN